MKLTTVINRKKAAVRRSSVRARAAITLGGCALALGGFAAAAAASGPAATPAPKGAPVGPQMAACLAAHSAYCGPSGSSAPARPALKPTGPVAPMTRAEAVNSALRGANPAAKANASLATASETTLGSYEKAAYGAKHVNAAVAASRTVWVVRVASAPNPLDIDTFPGQKAKVYTHFTVVIDAASHQWIEESFQQ